MNDYFYEDSFEVVKGYCQYCKDVIFSIEIRLQEYFGHGVTGLANSCVPDPGLQMTLLQTQFSVTSDLRLKLAEFRGWKK